MCRIWNTGAGMWDINPHFFQPVSHVIRDFCEIHVKMFPGFRNVLVLSINLIHGLPLVGY